ncbi:MAG: SUMF1/EgtB/PvdO family nonheme iron enzyme, partial [Chloroflexi bacterium]|nr:SUMF1/EgtB/PvdO family nonheme iron enzyme [Chloroflexota bacterium]
MTQSQTNWVGHTIANRYKLEAVLGQGGMSTVYKAVDTNLHRTVAVKLIHPHLTNDPEFVRRFEQEAAAVARLRHPNIIQVYDFNHEDNLYYMVLEYIPGEPLQDRLKALNITKQRLPLSDMIQLMATICDTVAYAHERGMIHRDLKPANVILNPQGQPILMDFGVAKMLSDTHLTATGTIVGTARYMSPEQASGEHPDKRTDIYSLGVVLFEMTTGRLPFEGDSDIAVLMKHVTQPVPDIRQIQSGTPDLLVRVIEKALAKNPADRYQSVADMARALRAVDLNAPYHPTIYAPASSTSSFPPPAQPIQQDTKKAGLPLWLIGAVAAIIVLALTLGAAFVLVRLLRPGSEEQTPAPPTEQVVAPTEEPGESPPAEQAVAVEEPVLPSSKSMVKIAGGLYTVGQDVPSQNYAPRQQVELTEFWIDQYEVTNAQYAEFLAKTDHQPPASWPDGTFPSGQENHPVKGITWDMAEAYCAGVNKRLPTEAEWEVAARGAEDWLYPWGDDQRAVELPQSGTYEVGSIAANKSPFGVFDMAGNVWEWVGDMYAPAADGHRVLHGGENGFFKDMAYRLSGPPDQESIIKTAGIRCAAEQVEIVPVTSVLYEEEFVDESGGWPQEDEEGSPYRVGYHPPDYYHVEVRAAQEHIAVAHEGSYGDVTVETTVLVDHTDTETGDFRYGLTLRQSGENQYYAFVVSSRSSVWQVLKRTASGLEVLGEGAVATLRGFAPAGLTPDKLDKLRVDARGTEFVFWVNDEVVGQVSDEEYSQGEVGFYVETFDETLAHIHYDSLTIREVEPSGFDLAAISATPTPVPAPEGMTLVPAGYFQMGSSTGQAIEAPEHPVFLDASYIDLFEVTNAQYRKCIQERGCTQAGAPDSVTYKGYRDDPAYDTYPVIGVTWDQADAYCKWANKHLPTEAQWEYAASGPEDFTWPWGNTFKASLLSAGEADTQPVGSYPDGVSPFGVFDMAGNVWEWVGDTYAPVVKEGDRVLRGGENGLLKDMAYRLEGPPNQESIIKAAGIRCAADKVNVVQTETAKVEGVLEQDNFADPGSGWPILSEGSYLYGYHPPDFYHVEVGQPNAHTVVSREPDFENVTVETNVLVDHTDTEKGDFRYGLALRRSGDNYYAFTVSSRTGIWQVLKSASGRLEVLAEGSVESLQGFAPLGFTPDKTDSLRVDANGSNFSFHINGQLVSQISDSDYTSGQVGFFVETFDETLAHIHYDELTVREVAGGPQAQAPVEGVLVQDDFKDPNSGWPALSDDKYLLGYHPPDYYHVQIAVPNDWVVASKAPDFTDVTVETEVLVDHTDSETGNFRYGLALRRSGDDQFYAFVVSSRA